MDLWRTQGQMRERRKVLETTEMNALYLYKIGYYTHEESKYFELLHDLQLQTYYKI